MIEKNNFYGIVDVLLIYVRDQVFPFGVYYYSPYKLCIPPWTWLWSKQIMCSFTSVVTLPPHQSPAPPPSFCFLFPCNLLSLFIQIPSIFFHQFMSYAHACIIFLNKYNHFINYGIEYTPSQIQSFTFSFFF